MEEYKEGYKVVRVEGGTLRSCHASQPIEYEVDRWVYPEDMNGPLAVFDSLARASLFAFRTERVYKCRYLESSLHYLAYGDTIERDVPTGTCFADAVMLIGEPITEETTNGE